MNEAYEVELFSLTASFMASPFDLVLGVERLSTLKVDESEMPGFTDVEWQVVYQRVLDGDHWYFLPHTMFHEIEELYSDQIGDKLWQLTARL